MTVDRTLIIQHIEKRLNEAHPRMRQVPVNLDRQAWGHILRLLMFGHIPAPEAGHRPLVDREPTDWDIT